MVVEEFLHAAVAGYDEVVESSGVWPSGSALLAISALIMPLAPGRFSTIVFFVSAAWRGLFSG